MIHIYTLSHICFSDTENVILPLVTSQASLTADLAGQNAIKVLDQSSTLSSSAGAKAKSQPPCAAVCLPNGTILPIENPPTEDIPSASTVDMSALMNPVLSKTIDASIKSEDKSKGI